MGVLLLTGPPRATNSLTRAYARSGGFIAERFVDRDGLDFNRPTQERHKNVSVTFARSSQWRSVEKVLIDNWHASVTLVLLVFNRLDLAS